MLDVVQYVFKSIKSRSTSAVTMLPELGLRYIYRMVVGQVLVVGYVTATPVLDRYMNKFPVVVQDIERLALIAIELP